jgi:asparagine synthase (glutamine-hydrolysing)
MCGICGEVTFNGAPADPAAVARMMDALAPRGPDASGMVVRGRTPSAISASRSST